MKTAKLLFSASFLLLIISSLSAQQFEIPKNYKFETEEDYKKYEQDILNAIEYLEKSSFTENTDYRKEVNAFLVKYLVANPSITIVLRSFVTQLAGNNKDFLITYMGGWARYSIVNNFDNDEFPGSLAGLNSVLTVYTTNESVVNDSFLDGLLELKNERKLEQWLQQEIEKDSAEE